MSEEIIRLNVGGASYSTTKQTLSQEPNSIFSQLNNQSSQFPNGIVKLNDGVWFIDRDGDLFSHILQYLRSGKLILPEGFREFARLRDETEFYQIESLREKLIASSPINTMNRFKMSNGGLITSGETVIGGYITLGYRGTFAFGRDGQADVKFRKLHRILVCGRATLCREIFGDTLNESRDPGGPDDGERYTSRLYLKHQCLERACDLMAEKGFKLVATCCSGANGLAAANHPVLTGQGGPTSQSDLMNHRNCGDYEEQRWAHYTEYVFYREPIGTSLLSSPREI
ncbi:unnamed protein product [Auanema sp. JU1783]|nr:unnamed protein product [Auanema sp. JU1783]